MKGILVILKTKNIMDNNNKNGKKLDTGINCGDQTVKSEKEDGETKETDLNLDFYHESRFNGSENAYTPICSSLACKKIDSILVNHQRRERKDRFGTLISHDPHEFESEYQGEPPENRTHKPYKVTFKDKQMGESLAVIIEVESYKKFNNIETENKLCCTIM